MSLAFSSALQIAARIRQRELSALEALDYFKQRVEGLNARINAIVVFDWERAYHSARAADAALAAGAIPGPLHGVPITVKESFDVAGLPTTRGEPVRCRTSVFGSYVALSAYAARSPVFCGS